MQDRLNIAVFVDYDNIEIGVKSTLRREFDVALVLNALKERGNIIAKFAYANWSRQESAARQMAENAVQMVQRLPSPRGDKNGGDINLALDSLEMAFTHDHVNAFAIVSGDSDFIPLVNKLKEYGKTVYVVGGKAFTSTILQQNCHEFISFESLLDIDAGEPPAATAPPPPQQERERDRERDHGRDRDRDRDRKSFKDRRREREKEAREAKEAPPAHTRPDPLDLALSMPLVERALQVLERRNVQPQLGLLKSTMLQLDSAFNESAYGARSFSDFVERLKRADLVWVKGSGGRLFIERRHGVHAKDLPKPDEALPLLRDSLETHRIEMEDGVQAASLESWMSEEHPNFSHKNYGFQEFVEFLNFAQDKQVARLQIEEEHGVIVHLGAEFYPPALPEPGAEEEVFSIHDIQQPIVRGQPTATGEIPVIDEPPPMKPKKRVTRKKADGAPARKTTRRKKP
jgi:uncharacterized protein (TIGR00288 family)